MFDLRRDIKDRTLTHIAFQDLWHLFELGQEVMTSDADPQVYRVIRWTGGRPDFQSRAHDLSNTRSEPRSSTFIVDVVYLDFDGSLYSPVQQTFAIRKYDGERAISNLSVFPLVFDPDHKLIREELVARGNRWLQLARADYWAHKSYKGPTVGEQPIEVDSQIIVDMKAGMVAFDQNMPQIGGLNLTPHNTGETHAEEQGPFDGSEHDDIHQDHDLDLQLESAFLDEHQSWLVATVEPGDIEDEDKILLPSRVYAFALRLRKFVRLDVNRIEEVTYTSGFDALVLPDGHKETVRALVANHARGPVNHDANSPDHGIDLVRGKGEGLVVLLHGAPGVGKTSTAECVADSTKRPLYPITCGDIGDTAADVQANLDVNFRWAHKWGCVLLLDEADIFLQKRDKHNITRNSIVSVFLRTLEYYSGILILTTNRVGTFDPAFRSRIHVSLYYPPLKKDATMQIWKMHLNRALELKGKDMKINTKDILKFAKDHYYELKKAGSGTWNGRYAHLNPLKFERTY